MIALQAGNIGTKLLFEIVDEEGAIVDLSLTTTKTLYIQHPSTRRLISADMTFETDGTDGQVYVRSAAGYLVPGEILAQCRFVWPSTGSPAYVPAYSTDIVRLPVADNLFESTY